MHLTTGEWEDWPAWESVKISRRERRVFFLEFFKNGRGIESTPLRTIQMGRISERSQSLRDLPRRKRKVKRVKSIRKSSPATISFLPLLAYNNRTPSSFPREGQSRCHKFASYPRNLGNWKEICGGMQKKIELPIGDFRFRRSTLFRQNIYRLAIPSLMKDSNMRRALCRG